LSGKQSQITGIRVTGAQTQNNRILTPTVAYSFTGGKIIEFLTIQTQEEESGRKQLSRERFEKILSEPR